LGTIARRARRVSGTRLRVYPRPEHLQSLIRPWDTAYLAGNQVARDRGEGIEFVDIRAFETGDRVRAINWRATARRSRLWVNQQHPERSTDVVLFLDAMTAGSGHDHSLERAVRAVASLAATYTAQRDRVGLVTFGGLLRWLEPGLGPRQQYRIVEAL